MVRVKICGLIDEASVDAAVAAGADDVGFVIVPTSPRYVPFERAAALALRAENAGAEPWIVCVGAPEDYFWRMRDWDVGALTVQMHGDEPASFVAEMRSLMITRRIAKAIPVAKRKDLEAAADFAAADMILLDAKPPKGADRAGGHGAPFKWSIVRGWRAPKPWILSGGLTPENVAEAIRVTGAQAVDVSTGVESAPAVKDPVKMRAFVQAVKTARAR